MKVFVTGATGFIGSHVARLLRERGDDVVALVRSPARATALVGIGCELIEGDLNNRIDVDRGVEGSDAVIHLAARWEVGIPKADCPKMEDVNVGGVRRVLDSASENNTPRAVYVSTVNVFGDTKGQIADESYQGTGSRTFYSCYESSKFKAHKLAESRIQGGAPVVIVQPGLVYGPGDHSEVGRQILMAARGRLRLAMLTDIGLSMTYVDDVAQGIIAALDTGVIGESYVLAGENVRLRQALEITARLAGTRIPSKDIPAHLLRLVIPYGSWLGPKLGYPPNLRELIDVADGKTYWASSAKATEQLGYSARSLEDGLRATLAADGITVS